MARAPYLILVRVVLVLLLVAALALGIRWALREQLEPKAALAVLRSVQDRWWAVPAFLGAYLVGTSVFLPAVLFHMIAGAGWGFAQGSAVNLIAVNGAASAQFFAGRALGRERVAGLLGRYGLRGFDDRAARHGFRAMVAIRMLPLPFVAVNVAAGVSAMRWRDFALGNLVGSLPVMLVYTYFAAALVEGVAGAEREAFIQMVIAGGLVILATFLPRALGRLRARRLGARNRSGPAA